MLRKTGVYKATTYHASGHHHYAQVGEDFATQYYNSLCLYPQNTCKFYREEGIISRPGDHGMRSVTTIKDIQNEIVHSDMTNMVVILLAIYSQETIAESVIVGVTGLFSKVGMSKGFNQTFLLAPHASGFYVKNDFLRFIDTPTDIAKYNEVSMKENDTSRENDDDAINQISATIEPATTDSSSTRIVKTILVKDLPPMVTRKAIIHALKDFGPVKYRNIHIRKYNDGYSYAFVEFNNPRDANQVVQAGSFNLDGRECLVEHKEGHTEGL